MATITVGNAFSSEASNSATNYYLNRSNLKFGHISNAYYVFGKTFSATTNYTLTAKITGTNMNGNGTGAKTLFWKIIKFHSYTTGSVSGMKFIHFPSNTSTNQSVVTISSNTADTVDSGSFALASGTANLSVTITSKVMLQPNQTYLLFVYDYGGSTTNNSRVWQNCAISLTGVDAATVKIYNGSSWADYIPQIWNGSAWDTYQAFTYSGGWNLMS